MPAVEEWTNIVVYETKLYKDVKTGFTIFQKDDSVEIETKTKARIEAILEKARNGEI